MIKTLLVAIMIALSGTAAAQTTPEPATDQPPENKFSSGTTRNVGDTLDISSLSVGGYNFAVRLQISSHANQFSPTFQVLSATPTSYPATATYNMTSGLVYIPNVRTTFPNITGANSCLYYDITLMPVPYTGYWITHTSIAKNWC